MLVLAFDTSTDKGGVALMQGETVLSRAVWERQASHSELLTPAIHSCLEKAGYKPAQIDAIAVGHGPGSFTGVRVAVNAARALAYVLKKPVYAFDTTTIVARQVTRFEKPVAVLINAHKNLLYASTFEYDDGWKRATELKARSLEEVSNVITRPHICVGDGFDVYQSFIDEGLRSRLIRDSQFADEPHSETLGTLVHEQQSQLQPLVWNEVQALYIRASGAEEKLREEAEKRA